MAILAMSCLLSLFPEDAKGSGRLLTGRQPLPHSRLSLRERWKKELDHVAPSRSAANAVFNLTLLATFLMNLTFWGISGRLA